MNKRHWPLLLGATGWFSTIYWLAERGTFVSPNKPPMAVGLAFTTPILVFLMTERIWPSWRARVTSVSPVLFISMNGWRFIGLGFLMANIEGLLPTGFAWPAGLGDIIMAITAPWVAARVLADDRFRFGIVFLMWNLFGIADFLDAVLLGTLYNTGLMQRLPLVLIPCFFVPLLFIVHITLLEQRTRKESPVT
jgi:hypothetical protein